MARKVVYVVCAEGDEKLAEHLAEPLKKEGYQVAHNGTVTLGESLVGEAEKALSSGSPIVLCATAKAVGSAWAHKIVNAAYHGGQVRVFVVQMERQAYIEQLALDGKIARYWDDPAQALEDLLGALAKYFPSDINVMKSDTRPTTGIDRQFLDQLTDSATFDVKELEKFRAMLREDIAVYYPLSLTPWEFLSRAGVWVEGRLTLTGALLFARNTTDVFPTSMVKCARYYGVDRTVSREIETFEGTVQAQIFSALQFVTDRVRIGEAPKAGQAQSAEVYEYPMVAVREIIANAVVHRDYASMDSCVHVRLFTDRLEISSPGSWYQRDLEPGVQYDLSSLSSQSRKRNFRLAHELSWIKLVEGEGTGILATLTDCEIARSPMPTVVQDGGFVTVTIRRRELAGRRPRTLRSIGLWGPPASGKSTFLAALYIAVTRSSQDMNIFGVDDTSTEFMVESNRILTSEHRFPEATMVASSYSWTMNMTSFVQPRGTRLGSEAPTPATVPIQINIDLRDIPGGFFASEHIAPEAQSRLDLGDMSEAEFSEVGDAMDYLAACDGLLLFIDPDRELEYGDNSEYFQGTLARMAQRRLALMPPGSRLPHYVAVCITKFDEPHVYDFARSRGYVSFSEDDPHHFPRVTADSAENFFRDICENSARDIAYPFSEELRKYFSPDRIRFFVTSSIGFYVGPTGSFSEDDFQNVIIEDNYRRKIRGHIYPVNVVEPLIWLGQPPGLATLIAVWLPTGIRRQAEGASFPNRGERVRPGSPVESSGVILDQLLDGSIGAVIGGIIGAVGTGAAQIWLFRQGKKSARADQSVSIAADLLSTLYAAKNTLRVLPYTEAAPGSPLSYGERGDRARPMLDELRRAAFVEVPLLTDRELARRFRLFLAICEFTASTSVDASEVHEAVKEADAYADHLRACLVAHIDEAPIPAAPALTIMAPAAEQQMVIASVTKRGKVVKRENKAA